MERWARRFVTPAVAHNPTSARISGGIRGLSSTTPRPRLPARCGGRRTGIETWPGIGQRLPCMPMLFCHLYCTYRQINLFCDVISPLVGSLCMTVTWGGNHITHHDNPQHHATDSNNNGATTKKEELGGEEKAGEAEATAISKK